MLHSLHRLYTRLHVESPRKVSFDEATGEVCTSTCRREARLDAYHDAARYNTLVNR
jgi:hypothetical protein